MSTPGAPFRPFPSGPPAHWPRGWPFPPRSGAIRARSGAVATTDRYASEVGVAVLRGGGSAVDAAVAAAFALAVVNPEAGNLGGSGFLVARSPSGETTALDFRSTAPASATPEAYVGEGAAYGVAAGPSLVGPRAVATPGTVMGLHEAHRRHGRLPWEALVQPAVGLARGFVVGERFLRAFGPDIQGDLRRFPSSERIFFPGGSLPRAGDLFVQEELAATLEGIRDRRADGFYRGETAARIAEEMRRGGGFLTEEDLAGYRAIWRDPVRAQYRGHTLATMPPPSSAGIVLAVSAHILDDREIGTFPWHGVEEVHLLAEAWRRAFADRNAWLGDPDFESVPTERLVSREYGRKRGADLSMERATPSRAVAVSPEGNHTTHISVIGPDGDAAALTTTLNTWFGSRLVAEGTGVLLNCNMDDFALAPGRPNYFGLVEGEANRMEPGKRMLSAMAPTIVTGPDGELRLVLGAAGGPAILTTVFQVISNLLDHGLDLATAVNAPRVHHQHLPDEILHEPGGLPAEVREGLERLGHRVRERGEFSCDLHAILVGEQGVLQAVSDPRRGGAPAGF